MNENNGTALAVITEPGREMARIAPAPSYANTLAIAQACAASGFFADCRQEAQAVVKILAGQEIGIAPVTAMREIHIISGKVTYSAAVIAAKIKGSLRYDYRVTRNDDTGCVIKFYQLGTEWQEIGESLFTIEDAAQAQLLSNPTYKKFPRNMLYSRALTNGARWYCPDVFSGSVYTPDELGATIDLDGNVVDDIAHVAPMEPTLARKAEISANELRKRADLKVAGQAFMDAFGNYGLGLLRGKRLEATIREYSINPDDPDFTAEYVRASLENLHRANDPAGDEPGSVDALAGEMLTAEEDPFAGE